MCLQVESCLSSHLTRLNTNIKSVGISEICRQDLASILTLRNFLRVPRSGFYPSVLHAFLRFFSLENFAQQVFICSLESKFALVFCSAWLDYLEITGLLTRENNIPGAYLRPRCMSPSLSRNFQFQSNPYYVY